MKWTMTAREFVRSFYERYDRYLNGLVRFMLALSVFLTIIYQTGYNQTISSPFAALGLALIMAFLPVSALSVITSILLVGELFSASMEVAVITAVMILTMLLSYFVFRIGNSYLMVLTMLFCMWNLSPALLPLGLLIAPIDVIPMIFGVLLYGVVVAVKKDFSVLASQTSKLSLGGRVNLFLTDFISNNKLLLILVALTATLLLICIIRRSRINYAPVVAAISGGFLFLISFVTGNFLLNIDIYYAFLIIGLTLDVIISAFIVHFVINADYKRTEFVQFEDEEYYYFVKAVPKRTVSLTEKKVENITEAPDPRKLKVRIGKTVVRGDQEEQ